MSEFAVNPGGWCGKCRDRRPTTIAELSMKDGTVHHIPVCGPCFVDFQAMAPSPSRALDLGPFDAEALGRFFSKLEQFDD